MISGAARAMQMVVAQLQEKGIKTKRLTVSHAFHSALMDPILDDFLKVAQTVRYSSAQLNLVSNITGEVARQGSHKHDKHDISTPDYWMQHIRLPVRFYDGMKTLRKQGVTHFIEVGPKPILLGMGQRCLANDEPDGYGTWLPSLRANRASPELLSTLGQLYTHGLNVDWRAFYQNHTRRRVTLPTYPFQRERHWVSAPTKLGLPIDRQPDQSADEQAKAPALQLDQPQHALLGARLPSPHPIWQVEIDQQRLTYLNDHRIQGEVVYPAAAYVEMALAAAELSDRASRSIEINFQKALFLAKEPVTLQLLLEPSTERFDIYSQSNKQATSRDTRTTWHQHATGTLHPDQNDQVPTPIALDEIQQRLSKTTIKAGDCYRQFRQMGLEYGPSFQGIEQVWVGEAEALAQITLSDVVISDLSNYYLHPAMLDSCFQVLVSAIAGQNTYLPVEIERIRLFNRVDRSKTTSLWAYASLRKESATGIKGDLQLLDRNGHLLVEIQGLHCRALQNKAKARRTTGSLPKDAKPRSNDFRSDLANAQVSLLGKNNANSAESSSMASYVNSAESNVNSAESNVSSEPNGANLSAFLTKRGLVARSPRSSFSRSGPGTTKVVTTGQRWQQTSVAPEQTVPFEVGDLSTLPSEEQLTALENKANQLQASLNLS